MRLFNLLVYPEPPRAVRVGPPPSDDLSRFTGQGGRVQVGTPQLPSGGLGLLQGGEDMAFKIIFIFEYITPIIRGRRGGTGGEIPP